MPPGGGPASVVRRTTLPSGLRIITEAMPGSRSAALGVWVGAGSRDERATLNGASHFLEHLLFKGTPTRSAWEISRALDAVGGELNAFTAKEYTCFHARVLDADLPLALDILGDMITSSTIAAADVDIERQVILDELAMHDDDPEDVAGNAHAALAYDGHALGRPIGGTEETIESLTRRQIVAFYRAHYTAPHVVVAIAGNVDHSDVVRRVTRAFAGSGFLAGDAAPVPLRAHERHRRAKTGSVEISRPFEQINLVLGVDALRRGDERRHALAVLSAALGGGPSSRLFQEARERRALAYSVYSYAEHHADAGVFCVAAGCLPDRAEELTEVIRAELRSLAAHGLTPEELSRAQGQLRGGLILGLEDSSSRMSRIGKAELLYADLRPLDAVMDSVAAVTHDDVQSLAAELFARPETLAVVGPA